MVGSQQRRQETEELKDKREESQERSIRGFKNKFEMDGFMAQKGLWNLAREKILRERGALPNEEVTPLESTRLCMKNISWAAG